MFKLIGEISSTGQAIVLDGGVVVRNTLQSMNTMSNGLNDIAKTGNQLAATGLLMAEDIYADQANINAINAIKRTAKHAIAIAEAESEAKAIIAKLKTGKSK